KNFGRILVCYEAGYDGFWLARLLTKVGIECRVLDPASLQVNRRARRVKTDRIDALALLRALIAIDRGDRHVCAVVRVPTRAGVCPSEPCRTTTSDGREGARHGGQARSRCRSQAPDAVCSAGDWASQRRDLGTRGLRAIL